MRLWYQSAAPLAGMGAYAEALRRHVANVVSPGTEVEFHGLPVEYYAGRAPAEVLKYAYPRHLILSTIVENCLRAQRENFDAVVLASYNDPFVREARSVVDIPVVSVAESTLLIACTLARRFALVTLNRESEVRLQEIVERHTLERRVSSIVSLDPPVTERELSQAFTAPEQVLGSFRKTAAAAIESGADLIIPAEGVLNEVLVAHGVSRLHDVPVLDCIGTVLLHAEMSVALRQRTGLAMGRRWEHARADQALLDGVRAAVLGHAPRDKGP